MPPSITDAYHKLGRGPTKPGECGRVHLEARISERPQNYWRYAMPLAGSLKDIYIEEMRDLW